jgi:hypothetical protein
MVWRPDNFKSVTNFLANHTSKHFRIHYSPSYTTFITHHILADPQHPLYNQQKRKLNNRKQEGLWWHVTAGIDLSKSSVVRNTCRKRLRNAFTTALQERGFDERGVIVDAEALKKHLGGLGHWLQGRNSIGLTGSLRLHVQKPCIPAKVKDVKVECEMIIEALLGGLRSKVMQASREPARAKVLPSHWDALPESRDPLSVTPRKRVSNRKSPAFPNCKPPRFSPSLVRRDARSQRSTANTDT